MWTTHSRPPSSSAPPVHRHNWLVVVAVQRPRRAGAPTRCSQHGGANAGERLAIDIVLALAIAVVNTLAMSVAERVREFALLRLAGATRRQVLGMLRTEALSVLLLATALGSGIALAVLTAFSVGMTGEAAPAVALVYVAVVALAGLLALVATALPGRVALRVRPVTVATAKE